VTIVRPDAVVPDQRDMWSLLTAVDFTGFRTIVMKTATAVHRWTRWLLPLVAVALAGLTLVAPVWLLAQEESESEDQPAPELPSKLESVTALAAVTP